MQGVASSMTDTFGNIKPWLQKVTTVGKAVDSKYFSTTKKGEMFELKAELSSEKKDKRKEAIKKVIASMTVGKDVSALFPDVVNCMQTDNLELKKLVYLYLMNYAKTQPDTAILAVNTFVKDCDDSNPLIRALAVRTMGCIRVDKITAYLCDPLRKCLKDEDPYVRKTAAVCVAKLYDIDAAIVQDNGFLEPLKDLLSDSNAMVVANAVAAISEILECTQSEIVHQQLSLTQPVVNKLLTALNECTEWGQVFIMDAIANYEPADATEAQGICERVMPRLSHANAAVVLSAVKVIMKLLDMLGSADEFVQSMVKKLTPPLVTQLSAEPEIQYVALRNINLIVQKRPDILRNEVKVFFVKYNDTVYVKMEKLDIMIRLTTAQNVTQVLAELKEYAMEVDVEFVRKSVRAIGRCAIKVDVAAERCVATLNELVQTKVNYVVQEAIVVIKDIFRKYPNKYEAIIGTLCENVDTLDDPDARASMIWIIGEYAERIDNAEELLESFVDGFQDENAQVQLQLLTAVVKLFLKRPSRSQDLVQTVLTMSTMDTDKPDLRDRGYIYWRLLSTDPAAAKDVVLAEKPLISEETDLLEPSLLDDLISHLGSLASVYHQPPSSFVNGKNLFHRPLSRQRDREKNDEVGDAVEGASVPTVLQSQTCLVGDLMDLGLSPVRTVQPTQVQSKLCSMDLLGDGLDNLLNLTCAPSPMKPRSEAALADLFGVSVAPVEMWLTVERGNGLQVQGAFSRHLGSRIIMDLTLTSHSTRPLTDFAIQLNKNSFGLAVTQPMSLAGPLLPGESVRCAVPLDMAGPVQRTSPLTALQVALRASGDVHYFQCVVPLTVLMVDGGAMDRPEFLATWRNIAGDEGPQCRIEHVRHDADRCSELLKRVNVFTVASRAVQGQHVLYQSLRLANGVWVLAELKVTSGESACTLVLKSRATEVHSCVEKVYRDVLT